MQLRFERVREEDLRSILSWVGTYEMVQWSGPWNFTFPLDEGQLARFFLNDAPGEGLRTGRAIEVLEHLGTPEARDVLQELSRGAPAAYVTQEAKAALTRLARMRAALP
jgi:hypothetical protein